MRDDVAALVSFDGEDAPEGSEEAIALVYATYREKDLRYVSLWGQWLRWDGVRWCRDGTLQTFDEIRSFVRTQALAERNEATARAMASAKTVASVERLARSDRRLAANVDLWDDDALALGTPGGTVDLRSGVLCAAAPERYITKIAKVTPADPETPHPVWTAFLNDITAGDPEFEAYLQRIAGYCLTGLTTEHALFFLYGTGRNGKGVFVNTLNAILDEYAETASMETFIDSGFDRHPTEVAKLRGARFVTAQETERGRPFAEARIKSLTGGDKISARFMRQDFFTYTPQFKLMIVGNHLPLIGHVDEAMRARLHIVPFEHTIPEERRDRLLPQKMQQEWPAILRWAIDGCLAWQRSGLRPPKGIRQATDGYFSAQDDFANWLTDCCRIGKAYHTDAMTLFRSWTAWRDAHGERSETAKAFAQRLQSNGFKPKRVSSGHSGYLGVCLKHSADPAEGSEGSEGSEGQPE